MIRRTPEQKEFRKALASHLHHMHGKFQMIPGLNITDEELERIHEMMHKDEHACPAHEHKKPGPYDLGKIKLKYGKDYVEQLIGAIRGEF